MQLWKISLWPPSVDGTSFSVYYPCCTKTTLKYQAPVICFFLSMQGQQRWPGVPAPCYRHPCTLGTRDFILDGAETRSGVYFQITYGLLKLLRKPFWLASLNSTLHITDYFPQLAIDYWLFLLSYASCMRISQPDNDRLPDGDHADYLYMTYHFMAIKLPKHRLSFSGQGCQVQWPPGYPGFHGRIFRSIHSCDHPC